MVFDLAQPHHRHQRALQLADAHAPRHLGLTALAAVGEDREAGTAALRGAPGLAQFHQTLVVQRVLGHQRAHAQLHRALRVQGGCSGLQAHPGQGGQRQATGGS